jgi:serine/threonine-protein kinase
VRIKSEYVARVSDVGVLPNGAPFMVMEYLEGGDLAAWIEQRGALAVEQAVEFVLQACVAVADAHALGIVHRDLKPANLFCVRRSDGQLSIKVLDFGISKVSDPKGKLAGSFTKTSAAMGSPVYMAPEQMRSARDVDAKVDIWALGMILFELISGHPAFRADNMVELAIQITNDPAPPIRTFRPEVPAGLEAVISKCLEKDRARRYRNVAELALALAPFAPKRAKGTIERISGIIQAAGLSQSALALPPSPRSADTQLSAGTLPPVGRTTAGTSNRKMALAIGGGAGALLAALVVVGVLTFGRPAARPDTYRPTATEPAPAPEPSPTPAPAVTPARPADTVALDAGLVVPPPAVPPVPAVPAPVPPPLANEPPPDQGASQAVKPATPKHPTSGPCKLIETVDKNGEPHFSCPCATCR